jgi:outer membrane lipopolysaccharide assembly protein LptE/RlpB
MIKKISLITLMLLIIPGCGFKIVNQSKLINYSISKIETSGDKKINYNIRNKILNIINEDKDKSYVLKLKTEKNKSVKEKNIGNEITKYKLEIIVNVTIETPDLKKIDNFTVKMIGDYESVKQYSQTLNNEKRLIKLLSDNLADKILEQLSLKLDDL